MYRYKLSDEMKVAFFNGTVILLDLKNDNYILLDEDYSVVFKLLIKNRFLNKCDFSSMVETLDDYPNDGQVKLEELLNQKIIMPVLVDDQAVLDIIPDQENLRGNIDIVWRMTYGNLLKKSKIGDIIKASIALIKVGRILKNEGIHGLVNLLESTQNTYNEHFYKKASIDELEQLSISLDKACYYSFRPIKCLKWSAAFALLALEKKYRVTLNIGVQNFPFYAHAWVESDHKVVSDHPDVSINLAKILSIPFGGKS